MNVSYKPIKEAIIMNPAGILLLAIFVPLTLYSIYSMITSKKITQELLKEEKYVFINETKAA